MKTTAKILFLLLLVGSIATGCKKLLDVEFDADFKAPIDVNVPATSLKDGMGTVTGTYTLDPATNEKYKEYADKIIGLEVTAITGKITSITKDAVLYEGAVVVSKAGFTPVYLRTPTDFILTNNATYSYSNTESEFANLALILKDQGKIQIEYEGLVDQLDFDYTWEITFETTVTANVLGN
jgi:hypothetical protein